MNIRQATEKDIDLIADLTRQLFRLYSDIDTHYDNFDSEEDYVELKKFLREGFSKHYFLIAYDGDLPVGFLQGDVLPKKNRKIGFVRNVFVLERARGLGVGKKMIQDFFQYCKRQGADRVELISDVRSDAYTFWSKSGFTPIAHRMKLDI
jgi:GNAT superfamily N-acetyltransferase